MESRWVGILASIFIGFWWIFGRKLGRKIEPRQDKTGQDRARQDKTRQDKDKDKTRQDFGRERDGADFLRRGGVGFASLLGGYLPGGLDPGVLEGLGFRIATFWPSCCPSFFHHFFDAIFDRFWFDFASQLGSQNPPKSMKNQCQDAFPC